jgi:hypothetical protein
MGDELPKGVPKVHPASREVLPDDPLEMHGFEVSGDANLMLRLLVEEYAHLGWGAAAILRLARDPNYQAFHGLRRLFGEEELAARIGQILARCGVMRVKTQEAPLPADLIQLEIRQEIASQATDALEATKASIEGGLGHA